MKLETIAFILLGIAAVLMAPFVILTITGQHSKRPLSVEWGDKGRRDENFHGPSFLGMRGRLVELGLREDGVVVWREEPKR